MFLQDEHEEVMEQAYEESNKAYEAMPYNEAAVKAGIDLAMEQYKENIGIMLWCVYSCKYVRGYA